MDGLAELVIPETGEVLSFSIPDDLSFDQWVEMGRTLCANEKAVGWWIGDWWRHGHRYGERASAAARDVFGRTFQTLRNIGCVAATFETSRRRDTLSFSHHAEVAALPAAQADELLDLAEREEWSKRELRAEVNQRRNAVRQVQPPAAESFWTSSLDTLVARGLTYGTIYADPPWKYDNQGTRAATDNHYRTMTIADMCALPVRQLAADDAHLHLWTTNAFLFECPRLFDAWGFEFRSSFIWCKSQMGIGNYWRNSHEILLTAIRGDAKRFSDKSLKSWIETERGAHSAKPEQVRGYLERASPGPRLEMFARISAPGWTRWGDPPDGLLDRNVTEIT